MVLKEINEVLMRQRAFHPSLDQIKEMIEGLSEEDWSALLEWMEAQTVDDDDYDPEPDGSWHHVPPGIETWY